MSKKRSRTSEKSNSPALGKILAGGIAGLILTMLLTFAAAFAVSKEMLSPESSHWLGPVIIAVSAFFAAWLAARRNSKKLVCGLLSALLYGSAMMICGLLLFSAPMKAGRLALSLVALLLGTLAGVFLSGMGE